MGGLNSGLYNRYPFWGIDFGNLSSGIVVGGSGNVFTTSDGGATWVTRQSGSGTETYALAATDADHAWAANQDGELLYTTNGGQFWNRVNIFVPSSQDNSLNDVDFVDQLNGWAVSDLQLHHTTDGGRTWQNQPHGIVPAPSFFGVEAINGQIIIAVGGYAPSSPVILRSTDGGNTWSLVSHPFEGRGVQFYAIHFVNSTTGWTVSDGGGILKSTDAGASWVAQDQGNHSYDLLDISFVDASNGWTVGDFGTVLHTTNGGGTWALQNPGVTTAILGVSAVSPTTAWISGYGSNGSFVARTIDGGASWQPESIGDSGFSSMSAALFLDAENGWVGGFTGIYRRSGSSSPPPTPTPTPGATNTPLPTPTFTPTSTPIADTVTITRAEYRASKQQLRVEATSTSSTASLTVYVTSAGQLIGTLRNNGGRYSGQFSWPTNPQNITVRSSLGGSATKNVTLR